MEQDDKVLNIVNEIKKSNGGRELNFGEIRPGCKAPVLIPSPEGTRPELYTWGFRTPKSLVINARAETAAEKPMFRDGIAAQRCVIPSTGFFEWDGDKRKFLFTMPGSAVLYMAGIYAVRGGVSCYCVLTTQANETMREVHDRMPLVLEERFISTWLEEPKETARLLQLTPPALEKQLLDTQYSLW